MNWLFIAVSCFLLLLFFFFAAAVSLFLLQGKSTKKVLFHHMQQAGALEDFFTIMNCFWTTCEALYTPVRVPSQAVGFCRSWRFDLAQNYSCYRATIVCLDSKGLWKPGQSFISAGFTLFLPCSAPCGTEKTTKDTGCDLALPRNLCWSSSRLQSLQNNNLNKFAIIRPSPFNHDRNLLNCRGAPDETTCLTVFFRCPSALSLICTKMFKCLRQ